MRLPDRTLHQLLSRGEAARLKGSTRAIRISFKDPSSEYWTLTLADRDALHLVLRDAAAVGAVDLSWGRYGGDDRPLDYVSLKDLDLLARFLRVSTTGEIVTAARELLAPWASNERVQSILSTWSNLKKIRSLGPESAPDFADALRVLDSISDGREDYLARPLSVALFGNSKRLESLFTHLDILTSESTTAPARHWSEVLTAIGIRKEPQPFLVAGSGTLELRNGPAVPVARPFIGIASHALVGYHGSPAWVLTVENLTTFHQCAQLVSENDHCVLIYTAGMPSPSWLQAFSVLLRCSPESTHIYHWGDHDEGGFRIASRISSQCVANDRALLPWRMHAETGAAATSAQFHSMRTHAIKAGWERLASAMTPVLHEQESQIPSLPPISPNGVDAR